MVDLRSPADVRAAMRQIFGAAAHVDPDVITDQAAIRQPPPPADNLGLPAGAIAGLIHDAAVRLLGRKTTQMFADDVVLPDALLRRTFGPLADLLHAHFNSLALSAVFVVIARGLVRDPHEINIDTPIDLLDEAARRDFLKRVRDAIRDLICDDASFEFTQARATTLMGAKKVESAMDAVVGGLKDAIKSNRCL